MRLPDLRTGVLVVWLSISPVSLYAVDAPVTPDPVDYWLERLLAADADRNLEPFTETIASDPDQNDTLRAIGLFARLLQNVQQTSQTVLAQLLEEQHVPDEASLPFRQALADLYRLMVRDTLQPSRHSITELSSFWQYAPHLHQAHWLAFCRQSEHPVTELPEYFPAPVTGHETEFEKLDDLLPHLSVFRHRDFWPHTARWLDRHMAARQSIEQTPLTVRLLVTLEGLNQQYESTGQTLQALQSQYPENRTIAVIRAWLAYLRIGGGLRQADQVLLEFLANQPEDRREWAWSLIRGYRDVLANVTGQPRIGDDHHTEPTPSSQWTGWNLLPGAGAEESGDEDYREAARQSVLGLADNAERHKDEINAALHTMKDFLLQYGEADDVPDDPAQQLADKYRCLADSDQCLEPEDSGHGIEAEADEFLPESNI